MSPRNIAASVRQRLHNRAKERGEEFQQLLVRYTLERLLFRLCASPYADQFVLKGAMLFSLWVDLPQRPTRDADFLGFGDATTGRLATIFAALAVQSVDVDDGVQFDIDSVRAEEIRKQGGYPGVRISMRATLDGARIPVQCDIGFGDAVTPSAPLAVLPTLLGLPAPQLRVYPPETVVAEKLEALVKLGAYNSRLKDYFDLWVLLKHELPDANVLPTAVAATFARRGTELPDGVPEGLSAEFAAHKAGQWLAFLNRQQLLAPNLFEVVQFLSQRCTPLLSAARALPVIVS